jgi:oligoendopeptidase F
MLDFKPKTEWDLTRDYFLNINDPQIQTDTLELRNTVDSFVNQYKGKIANLSALDFIKFFELENKASYLISKINNYIFYLSSLDTQNQQVLKKQGEVELLIVEISNQTLFVSQEFKELGYEKLLELANDPALKDYKNYFVKTADSIKYILSENTEFALNLKSNSGAMAFNNLYEELTNSFMFDVHIDGDLKTVTMEEIRSLRMSNLESERKEALEVIREKFSSKQIQITLGNTYNSIVKNWTSEVKLRKYTSVISQRSSEEQLPEKSVLTMLSEVEKAYPIYHKYLALKAKLLGKTKLEDWNLSAPIDKAQKDFSFEEGLNLFLDKIGEFDQEFYEYSKDCFEQGKVDVFPKPGKRGGAYCSFDANFPSLVMLNYTNKLRDVSTIAHELGHSIHAHLALVQKPQVYYFGTSLAETASIFNETLLNNAIVKTLTKQDQLAFIENQLSDIFATIFRQVMYTLFEKRVHESILSGKQLTYLDFNKLWREEQIKLTGGLVEYSVPEEEESGWSCIPHIFATPFYCYSYAFGNILSFALYKQYLNEGKSFVEKYKNILRSGDSKTPYDLLIANGLDITSEEFYQTGLQVVADLVNQFEYLVNGKAD